MAFYKTAKQRRDKDKKPPFGAMLNSHHPLSQGLIGSWLFNEGGGNNIFNSINGGKGIAGGTVNWIGGDIDLSAGSSYFNCGLPKNFNFTTEQITFIMRVTFPSSSTTNDWFLGTGWYYFYNYSKDNKNLGLYAGGTAYSSNNVFDWGQTKNIAVKKIGTTATFYIDNIVSVSGATLADIHDSTGYNFMIGTNAAYSFKGKIKYCYVYNRGLNDTEIQSIFADPYQIFLPSVWDAYFVPAAAPPPTGGKSIFGYDSIFHAGGIIQT